jgi:hypothetical protein
MEFDRFRLIYYERRVVTSPDDRRDRVQLVARVTDAVAGVIVKSTVFGPVPPPVPTTTGTVMGTVWPGFEMVTVTLYVFAWRFSVELKLSARMKFPE